MAYSKGQTNIDIVASTTFGTADLHKFVGLTTNGHVVIGATTAAGILATLTSVTATTSGAGSDIVTIALLSGVGKVSLATSTEHSGSLIAASSAGLGIAPSTSKTALGTLVDTSSGTARIGSVLFHTGSEELST